MTRLTTHHALCLFALVLLLTGSMALAQAQDAPPQEAAQAQAALEPAPLRGYYAVMAKEAELTQEQRDRLGQVLAAQGKALDDWDEAKGQELEALESKLEAAKDAEAKRAVRRELRDLRRQRRAIEEDYDQQIDALMTPAQLDRVKGLHVYTGLMTKYKRLGLSDEQAQRLRQMADEAAPELRQLEGESRKAERERRQALYQQVEQDVLTAEQRAGLADAKQPNEAAEAEEETGAATAAAGME